MSAHTPGPWSADLDSDHGDYVIWCPKGQFLANIGTGLQSSETMPETIAFDVAKANALLMAAAPEMGALLLSMWQVICGPKPTREEVELVLRKAGLL